MRVDIIFRALMRTLVVCSQLEDKFTIKQIRLSQIYQILLEPSFDIAPFTYSLQLKHIDWTGLTDLYKKDTTM